MFWKAFSKIVIGLYLVMTPRTTNVHLKDELDRTREVRPVGGHIGNKAIMEPKMM
jgi:hypothetical protein